MDADFDGGARDATRSFFLPTKAKIGVALVTSFLYPLLRTGLKILLQPGRIGPFAANNFIIFSPIPLVVNTLLMGILIYPFACSLVSLYENRGDLKGIPHRILVLAGLLLFNPFVIEAVLVIILVFMITHPI